MLNTILRNLVSNAIKFTPNEGLVTISASHFKEKIAICVSDTGIGMDSKKAKDLFKISKVKSTIGTQGEQGTGLGLLLCKEFVEKHNGEIWVESDSVSSKERKGSKVWFTLPNQK